MIGSYSSSKSNHRGFKGFAAGLFFTGLACYVAGLFLPWWGLVITCILLGFLFEKMNRFPFLAGFFAVFLLWSGFAAWIDHANLSILGTRVIKLFPVPPSSFLLILITGAIGGLIGGFSALTGHTFRTLTKKKDVASRYY